MSEEARKIRRAQAENFLSAAPAHRVVLIEISYVPELRDIWKNYRMQQAQTTLSLYPGEWTCSWQDATHARAYPVDMQDCETVARALLDQELAVPC